MQYMFCIWDQFSVVFGYHRAGSTPQLLSRFHWRLRIWSLWYLTNWLTTLLVSLTCVTESDTDTDKVVWTERSKESMGWSKLYVMWLSKKKKVLNGWQSCYLVTYMCAQDFDSDYPDMAKLRVMRSKNATSVLQGFIKTIHFLPYF